MKTATLMMAAFVIISLPGNVAKAALIASESFATSAGGNDYVPFTSILGQNPTVDSMGFVDPWGTGVTASMVPIFGGLKHTLTPGETFDGQLVSYVINDTVGGGGARNLSRAIDYALVDGTYYSSVLLRKYASTTRGDLLCRRVAIRHGVARCDGS